jgi:23S rRNA (uracil1939-C5)-methyltransferase
MAYRAQLARKREALSRLLGLPVEPVVPSPQEEGFRHKVAFVFGAERGGRRLVMGHYARASRRVVPVEECPVHSARGNRIAFALRDALVRARVSPSLPRHVVVRTTSDEREAVAVLVVRENHRSLRAPVRAFLASPDRPDGFFVNVHDAPDAYLFGETTIHLAGLRRVQERGIGPSFLVSPTAFFQPNVPAARRLVETVVGAVGPASGVLDLYCGGGLSTVPLALAGAHVVAVEESREAVRDLQANLRANRVPAGRVRGVCARVEDALRREVGKAHDAVVLDPPRGGCAPGVIDRLFGALAPERAVYVSCNPEAFATDLPRIRDLGHRVERVVPVDMFPHTEHVETVVTLRRA